MNVIIAGSRNFNDYFKLVWFCDNILEAYDDIQIFSGKAPGTDRLGEMYAEMRGYPVKDFPAPWDDITGKPEEEIGKNKFGFFYWKKAGFYRNRKMAEQADMLIAFWDGSSPGTRDMIEVAFKNKIETEVCLFNE